MPTTRDPIENDEIERIWSMHLDGEKLSYMANQTCRSPGAIKRILGGPLPEALANDPRLRGYRYAWTSASAPSRPALAMVVYQLPIRVSGASFQRGMRAMRRLLSEEIPDLSMDLQVIEGLETTQADYDAAERMILRRGQPGFALDAEGAVRRLTEDDFRAAPEGGAVPEGPPPPAPR